MIEELIACPNCKLPKLTQDKHKIKCDRCSELYDIIVDTPVLIKDDSPVHAWYRPRVKPKLDTFRGIKKYIYKFYKWLYPEERIWTKKSQKAVSEILAKNNTNESQNNVVLIGAGLESVYRQELKKYRDIIRIGLANRSEVDLLCDICDIPLKDESLDLLLSSSVLEHVYNPELAVKEMYRVVKPGGYVYAEIPFLRAFHMIPVDYQRYTISGIEELFKRHGFKLITKGICSGPFTGLALYLRDFISSLFSFNKYIKMTIELVLSLFLHPIKYIDRLFENTNWATINACNYYYIGRKE